MKAIIDMSCEFYNSSMYKEIGEDYMFRKCLHKIIEEIDINEFKQFFEMTKIDPNSEENKHKLTTALKYTPEIGLLESLKQNDVIRFEVKLK